MCVSECVCMCVYFMKAQVMEHYSVAGQKMVSALTMVSTYLGSLPVISIPWYLEAAGPCISSPQSHQQVKNMMKVCLNKTHTNVYQQVQSSPPGKSSWLYL